MDAAILLAHLSRDLDAFTGCLDGDLAAPVEHCGSWSLYDLADHLGGGNLWAAAAVKEGRGDYSAAPAPREPVELAAWFRGTCAVLLAALRVEPSAPAWTLWPPRTVAFWQRRRCLETLVHLWDAETALGQPRPLAPELAGEGVSEVLDTMFPRQVELGRATPPEHAVRLAALDTGQSWVLGSGDPVASINDTAQHLFLMLWGRLSPSDQRVGWDGDRQAGLRALDRRLVP